MMILMMARRMKIKIAIFLFTFYEWLCIILSIRISFISIRIRDILFSLMIVLT